jgi:hypothetical protein
MNTLAQLLIQVIQPCCHDCDNGGVAAGSNAGNHSWKYGCLLPSDSLALLSEPHSRLTILSLFCDAMFTLPSLALEGLFSVVRPLLPAGSCDIPPSEAQGTPPSSTPHPLLQLPIPATRAVRTAARAVHTAAGNPAADLSPCRECWHPAPVVSPRDPRACLWFKQQQVPAAAASSAYPSGPDSAEGILLASAETVPGAGGARVGGVLCVGMISNENAEGAGLRADLAYDQNVNSEAADLASLASQAIFRSLSCAANAVDKVATSRMRSSTDGSQGLRYMGASGTGGVRDSKLLHSYSRWEHHPDQIRDCVAAAADVGVALLDLYRCLLLPAETSRSSRSGGVDAKRDVRQQPHLTSAAGQQSELDSAAAAAAAGWTSAVHVKPPCSTASRSLPGSKGDSGGTNDDVDGSGTEEEEEEAPNARFCVRVTR